MLLKLSFFLVSEKTCRLNEIFSCDSGESCVQLNSSIGTCKCKREYIRNQNGECIQSPNSNIPDTDDPVLPTPEGVYSHGTSGKHSRKKNYFMNHSHLIIVVFFHYQFRGNDFVNR